MNCFGCLIIDAFDEQFCDLFPRVSAIDDNVLSLISADIEKPRLTVSRRKQEVYFDQTIYTDDFGEHHPVSEGFDYEKVASFLTELHMEISQQS